MTSLCLIYFLSGGLYLLGISRCLSDKESPTSAGDAGLIPGLGRSTGGGNGNPQYSCLENSIGFLEQSNRSLVDDSLWGCKEWETTKQITLSFHAPSSSL